MRLRYLLIPLAFSLALTGRAEELPLTVIFTHKAFRMPGKSMEPTIVPGEIVYVDTSYFEANRPEVGNVVAYKAKVPAGALHIRRVVAVGAHKVQIKDAKLLVDGRELAEPYLNPGGAVSPYSQAWGPLEMPAGCIFLLGDFRDQSRDSRADYCYSAEDLYGLVKYVTPSVESPRRGR
jgi:signal peptidase I